jgi:hypothetical protein
MKAWISALTAVTFMATSSVALAGEASGQTMSTTARIEHGVAGAVTAAAGFSLHGTVLHAGAPWAMEALAGIGASAALSTVLVAATGASVTGLGIYQIVRGVVGTNPTSPLTMGMPGFVSGGILTAIGGEGIVQLGMLAAAGTAGLGLAFAATSIIAVVGVGFLAYGGYQAYKANKAKKAAAAAVVANLPAPAGRRLDGSNVVRNAPTLMTSVARSSTSPTSAPIGHFDTGVGIRH